MTVSVTQLNNYIKGMVEIDGVLSDLSVVGEITNVKQYKSGWFFSLKEGDNSINCLTFSAATPPVTGMMAVVEGHLNYYPKTGSLSVYVRRITSTKNTGESYLNFLELKEKLKKEGLFDDERKKIVPKSCQKVGIVTSETGAVIHDITNVVYRRQPFTQLFLYPVKVQGEGADFEIARGVLYFNDTDVDAVIVGRGGGSNEDLSVFNSEVVVRAIAACNKPIVSAVGHGVDFTLSDFAADKRAVTPTEAAEFVTLDVQKEKDHIRYCLSQIATICNNKIISCKDNVAYNLKGIQSTISLLTQSYKSKFVRQLTKIESITTNKLQQRQHQLDKSMTKLSALNPKSILQRGYAHISHKGNTLSSIDELQIGQQIDIFMQDGVAQATVTNKETK